jgi:hypothetical protein
MDYQWAEGQLRKYVQAVRDCASMQVLTKDRRKAVSDLNLRLPNINRILVSLTPDHSHIAATNVAQHQAAIPGSRAGADAAERYRQDGSSRERTRTWTHRGRDHE